MNIVETERKLAEFIEQAKSIGKTHVNLQLHGNKLKFRSHPVSFKAIDGKELVEDCMDLVIDTIPDANGMFVTNEADITIQSSQQLAKFLLEELNSNL